MIQNSIWSQTTHPETFEKLKGDVKTDVLIIGGGIAGILCAYFMHQAGINYLLVEGKKIGGGITKNTTAKITSQHGLVYDKLIKKSGYEKAKMYLAANQLAIAKFKQLSADFPCDFQEKNAHVYSLSDRKSIEHEVSALEKLGYPARFIQSIPLPFDIAGAVKFEKQAQFHPLKFIYAISKGLHIAESTFVKELSPHTALTDHGKISANHIIITTHFPFLNKHGGYFLKMYQHRSYAIAFENADDVNGMFLEEKEDGLSFRNHENLLIIGGGDHKTGKKGGNWKVLRDFAKEAYPGSKEKFTWATQDCMTLDGVPYIGKYAKSTEELYVATGFNKWGMTSAMVSAMILTDMIMGKKNEYAEVFFPSRSMAKAQLLINGFSALSNLLHLSTKRCPHMGCALKWNPDERSWDCPCHGSRFNEKGSLLDNPATGSIHI